MNRLLYIGMMALTTGIMSVTTSCNYDEDILTPSNEQTSYQLPQGSHDYDQTIQKFYDSYGVYLLYNFTDKDVYWTPTGWQNGEATTDSTSGKTGFTVKSADQNYVAQQIDLLYEVWFSKLDETARKSLLPTLILLCSEVNEMKSSYVFSPVFKMVYNPSPIYAHYNYDNISVTYGSQAVTSLTDADKKNFQNQLFEEWAEYLSEHKATPTEAFSSSVDYSNSTVTSAYGTLAATEVGLLDNGYNSSVSKDWLKFMLMMMLYSEDYLTEDPGDLTSWTSWNSYDANWNAVYDYDTNFHGILNAAKDTKGILKTRYNIVRQYFIDTFKFDLQSIGNQISK